MATTGDPRTRARDAAAERRGPRRWLWTSDQYHRLADAGYFDDRKVELIRGDLYEMTTNPPHDLAVYLSSKAVEAVFGLGFMVRSQLTLDLGRRYQPLPDIAVVEGDPRRDFGKKHPRMAVLILEISESSLRQDRVVKAHRYAQSGIPDYWILNLVDRQLEIRRNPGPDPDPGRKGRFRYANVTIVPDDGHASPLAKPEARIAVADLLP